MRSSFTSVYEIKKSDENYTNAIAAHGKKVFIHRINSENINGDPRSCEELPTILLRTPGEKTIIECSSDNSDSTFGAFPSVDPAKLLSDVSEEIRSNPSAGIEQANELISHRLDGFKKDMGPGCFRPRRCMVYNDPAALTQQEAIFLLTQLQNKYKDEITGSIHFPKHHTILFQFGSPEFESANFLLRYGVKTSFNKLPKLVLDIDDGFKISENSLADERLICEELRKYFISWKKNGYKGELIPTEKSGFQCYQTGSLNSSQNVNSFWQMPRRGAVLTACIGAAVLTTAAYVSYSNKMR